MNAATRTEPAPLADERTTLTGFLQYQRDTLAMKCAGLTVEQLRTRAVPPSSLSLLGLVRHLAEVERGWFGNTWGGEDRGPHWPHREGGGGEFDVDTDDPAEALRIWRDECARSRALVDAAESLDAPARHGGTPYSLRHILTHMIEEYARHNGHADLLRECLDGTTGE